ncbi:MAG: alpha/beta hydrolase [Bacteroidia bacterium]|nr:alpha/beta hydrolase [Bacteroidia bacterium]
MSSETKQEQTFKNGYAKINGINMYYEIHGTGQPLLMIHGGGSTMTTSFGTLIPFLSKSRQLITVDMQAHGRTSDRDTPLSFQQGADDVAELLKQLNIGKADILGFSNGGQAAMEVAIRHPEKVRKLVLLSIFYKRSGTPPQFWEFMKNSSFEQLPQVYKDEFLKVNNNPQALMNMYNRDVERMQNFKDWSDEALESIKAPSLIVMGDQDVATVEHAVEMHRLIQGSRLLIMPGNHGGYFGEAMSWQENSKMPGAFINVLEDFLGQ